MKMNSQCISCLLNKQEKKIRNKADEHIKLLYMKDVMHILVSADNDATMPWLSTKIDELYKKQFGEDTQYSNIKKYFNKMMLKQENTLRMQILNNEEPLYFAAQLARVGNYIDYGALEQVDQNILKTLVDNAQCDKIDFNEFQLFKKGFKGS